MRPPPPQQTPMSQFAPPFQPSGAQVAAVPPAPSFEWPAQHSPTDEYVGGRAVNPFAPDYRRMAQPIYWHIRRHCGDTCCYTCCCKSAAGAAAHAADMLQNMLPMRCKTRRLVAAGRGRKRTAAQCVCLCFFLLETLEQTTVMYINAGSVAGPAQIVVAAVAGGSGGNSPI